MSHLEPMSWFPDFQFSAELHQTLRHGDLSAPLLETELMCIHIHVFGVYVFMQAYFLHYKLIYGHWRNIGWKIKKKMCTISKILLPLTFDVFSRESGESLLWAGRFHLIFLGCGLFEKQYKNSFRMFDFRNVWQYFLPQIYLGLVKPPPQELGFS